MRYTAFHAEVALPQRLNPPPRTALRNRCAIQLRARQLVTDLLRYWYHCGTTARTHHPFQAGTSYLQHYIRGVNLRNSMASNTYSQGAQVEHLKFGLGQVLSSNEERIVIKFDDHGEKKFVTTLVMGSLKKSDRAAPIEKKGTRKKKAVAPATA